MPYPQHIILPDTGAQLLRRELALGFAAHGCRVSHVNPDTQSGALPDTQPDTQLGTQPDTLPGTRPGTPFGPTHAQQIALLAEGAPALLFSVNFYGLFPLRERLQALRQAGAGAAVWLVDNPWNILAGVRDPLWKTLPLFVTDAAFIAPLRAHGAERVYHLPLAASFELFAPNPVRDAAFAPPKNAAPLCFVGRSAFPGKEQFFAGRSIPAALEQEAGACIESGKRPDLLWWESRLNLKNAPFWPGKKARAAALGAENSNLSYRARCLQGASLAGQAVKKDKTPGVPGLDIYGDEGWHTMLPQGARLLPPVDYYSRLPGIYQAARYSLCLTSLQLPQGLNQRHFDIWAAGGFAISDATPGLALFPDELTRPIRFTRPDDLPALVQRLEGRADKSALQEQWVACLRQGHTYAHRAQTVLKVLDA